MRMKIGLLGLLTSLVLTACGGGGGGSSDNSGTAEGLWSGTTGDREFVDGVVLEDGTYWFIYSGVDDPTVLAGVVQGSSTSRNGDFSSSNARNFNFTNSLVTDGTISGNYVQKSILDGTAAATVGSVLFNLDYDNFYDETPSLAQIAGTYNGEDFVTGDPVTVTISGNGNVLSVSQNGCQSTGTVTPNSGGNVYNISITGEGGVCAIGTATVSGVAVLTAANQVVAAALNPARTNGFLFLGEKL